mgnify:CR=1 FL=1
MPAPPTTQERLAGELVRPSTQGRRSARLLATTDRNFPQEGRSGYSLNRLSLNRADAACRKISWLMYESSIPSVGVAIFFALIRGLARQYLIRPAPHLSRSDLLL